MSKSVLIGAGAVLAIIAAVFVLSKSDDAATSDDTTTSTMAETSSATKVVVYKSATCGCCRSWGEHMRKAGFEVEEINLSSAELTAKKNEHGVDRKLQSCHTAIVDGYVVEGHVPAEQVIRMLSEKPDIAGIAVAGMPIGAPGMEQGDPADYQDFDVMAFDKDGSAEVYQHVQASH